MRFKIKYAVFFALICVTAVLLNSTSLAVQQPALIPRDIIFGNPEKASPSISPDGSMLAYVAPDAEGVLNVWVRNLQGTGSKDRMITSDKKRGITRYSWQFDNNHILYVQDRDGDENWHLYQTNLKSGTTKDLTPFDGIQAKILCYLPDFPDEMLIQLNLEDRNLFDVYRMNLKTGSLVMDTKNQHDIIAWLADSQMHVRAGQGLGADGGEIVYVRDDDASPWRQFLVQSPLENYVDPVSFSKDGKFFYVVTSQGANTSRLIKMNVKTGEREVIHEDPEYDVTSVMVNPFTYEVEAVGVGRDLDEWTVFSHQIKEDFATLQQKGAVMNVQSEDVQRKKWVVGYLYDDKAPQFFLYDRETKKKEFLFSTRPQLDNFVLSKMKPISYQARDGLTIHGYLTLPEGMQDKNVPTIIFVHGGPNSRDTWGYYPTVQWMANRGYAVLQVNYRGSLGYGKKHLNAGDKEWGAKMHDDLIDGKRWLIANGYSDPDKIAIFGGSYGGYATLAGLAFTPDEFCCGVDIVGPSNLITLLSSLPSYWIPFKKSQDIRIGNIDTEVEFLKSRSPLFKAHQIKKPLLIAQGANDPRVKQAESDQIVDAMRKNNKPVEYLLFEDEGHGFVRPENRLKFYAAAEQFLSKYLGGRSQPPTDEENWESVRK